MRITPQYYAQLAQQLPDIPTLVTRTCYAARDTSFDDKGNHKIEDPVLCGFEIDANKLHELQSMRRLVNDPSQTHGTINGPCVESARIPDDYGAVSFDPKADSDISKLANELAEEACALKPGDVVCLKSEPYGGRFTIGALDDHGRADLWQIIAEQRVTSCAIPIAALMLGETPHTLSQCEVLQARVDRLAEQVFDDYGRPRIAADDLTKTFELMHTNIRELRERPDYSGQLKFIQNFLAKITPMLFDNTGQPRFTAEGDIAVWALIIKMAEMLIQLALADGSTITAADLQTLLDRAKNVNANPTPQG